MGKETSNDVEEIMKAYRCNCDQEFNTKQQMVAHYRVKHPDDALQCWSQIGTVGNAFVDLAIIELKKQIREVENLRNNHVELQKRYDELCGICNTIMRILKTVMS